jgi:phospholipid/cholesterol/gamma-HCH transport system substrate-binding protein
MRRIFAFGGVHAGPVAFGGVHAGPRRFVVLLVALLVLAGLASCGGGGDRITVSTTFDDVSDLADGAPVHMADVQIGTVRSIRLDDSGTRAEVEMSVRESAEVPADVIARVRRTSPLGEKFIELQPQGDVAAEQALLEDGAVIATSEVVPDLEQLVGSGTDFFAALGAGELAVLLDESAEGFGGQGSRIESVLLDLGAVTEGFAAHTTEINTLITSIDQLASDTAPAAQAHGDALDNLSQTVDLLDDESDELLALLDSLAGLSREGNEILTAHLDDIELQIDGVRSLTRAVASEQQSLESILVDAEGHNAALRDGVRGFFAQVLNDFVICGVPGGGDTPGDPLQSCDGE